MQLTGAQIVIECLKEQGVDTVFGYPGGAILNVYDELYKHQGEIRHVLTSHEQGASHAADEDEQCSSLGNSSTSWGAKNSETCIITERDCEFSLGQYLWSGFDYIGEPTPYHTRNSYFGQIDTAGFPKDSYYLYQAAWIDRRERGKRPRI